MSEICWVQGGKETSQLGVPTYNLWFCPDDGADYAVKIRWSTSKHGYRLVSVASQIHKLQKKKTYSLSFGGSLASNPARGQHFVSCPSVGSFKYNKIQRFARESVGRKNELEWQ